MGGWGEGKKGVCLAEDGTFERQGGAAERDGNEIQTEKFNPTP